MPYSPEQKAVLKSYFYRKIHTMPFFIMLFVALLLAGSYAFQWGRGQLLWHKTDAVITLVTTGQNYQYAYSCEKEETEYKNSTTRPKLFWYLPYGEDLQESDTLPMAYNTENPRQHVIFPKLESRMITWGSVFLFCFIMYFWLESVYKKKARIRLTG
ncbi:MAG: hypothetical protein K2J71_07560 [Oscillospiraceae bacterium]|nr:hypothetical protein [Oscillospiraceae bacterium]